MKIKLVVMQMYNFKDEDLETIIDLEQHPVLEISGEEDEDGFQIFTPEFIVNDMIKMVGMENIKDISKTILEPTSGDGAFTVRILEMRLNSLLGDNEYLRKSLISLSTIFSIEMDNKLMAKQRNNIYTLLLIYAKKANLAISNDYKVCSILNKL